MMFLLPVGGVVDHRFGIMTTPGHKGIPAGIKAGMLWAADNEAFTRGFESVRFFSWLKTMEPYRKTCIFVPVPDVVGDAAQTLANFEKWRENFGGWPVAFVGQDGQENSELPTDYDCLFVGGSTEWKLSADCESVIRQAQRDKKHIHIGRVNWWRRFNHFHKMEDSNGWTCDGTRQRFEGIEKTMAAWARYMAAPRQLGFYLFGGDHTG